MAADDRPRRGAGQARRERRVREAVAEALLRDQVRGEEGLQAENQSAPRSTPMGAATSVIERP
jgi:hypothetical protein